MAAGVSIRVNGNDALNKRLERFGKDVANTLKVHERIGTVLLAMTLRSFSRSATPEGKKWDELAPGTLRGRRKSKSPKPLLDTGRLRQSFNKRVTRAFVTVGSADVRSRLHQEGGPVPRRKGTGKARPAKRAKRRTGGGGIPARPMLPTNETARKEFIKVLNGHAREVTQRANT